MWQEILEKYYAAERAINSYQKGIQQQLGIMRGLIHAWIIIRQASHISSRVCSRDFRVLRSAWISSRLRMSISYRGLIARSVSMRRWWRTSAPCSHRHPMHLDCIETTSLFCLCCKTGTYIFCISIRIFRVVSYCMQMFLISF